MKLPVSCIVPARMASSRFPGKPLAPILGRPMILHTLQRAKLAGCFARVICATDSVQIQKIVESVGFECILTPEFPTGTDRVAWSATLLSLPLVVNLQGDEPLADPDLCCQIAQTLTQEPHSWITAASPLKADQWANPNRVKVRVIDHYAKEFSRNCPDQNPSWMLHHGIYGYSLDSLMEFGALPQSNSEIQNAIEPLRVLPLRPIRIVQATRESLSVDTPEDLAYVESYLQRNPS